MSIVNGWKQVVSYRFMSLPIQIYIGKSYVFPILKLILEHNDNEQFNWTYVWESLLNMSNYWFSLKYRLCCNYPGSRKKIPLSLSLCIMHYNNNNNNHRYIHRHKHTNNIKCDNCLIMYSQQAMNFNHHTGSDYINALNTTRSQLIHR